MEEYRGLDDDVDDGVNKSNRVRTIDAFSLVLVLIIILLLVYVLE